MFISLDYNREEMDEIFLVLHQLGLSSNYLGFYQMSWAVWQAMKEPERLLMVTKAVYPDVARQFRASWESVERNLRTAVRIIWDAQTPLLREILGEGRWERPSTARFLAILTDYMKNRINSGQKLRGDDDILPGDVEPIKS